MRRIWVARFGSLRTSRWRSWTPETLLTVGLLGVYLAFVKSHLDSIDGLLMYRQSTSLVLHRSIHLVPSVVFGNEFTDSRYGIAQSLVYAPFVGLGHVFGLDPAGPSTAGTFRQLYEDPLWRVACSWVNCVITAVTAYYVGKCLRVLGATRSQIIIGVLGFGLASPALTYSSSSFAQPLAALTFALAAVSLFRWSTGDTPNRILLAAAVALCLISRPVEGVMLGLGSLLFLVLRRLSWSSWLWPLAGLAVGATIDLVVNQLRFGSVFQTGYGDERWQATFTGVLGLSISPGRGIVWCMPLVLLVPLGLARLIRRRRSLEGCWLAGTALLLFANAAFWYGWWGGQAWGPRLLVPALPLIAVLAASAVRTWRTLALAAACVFGGFFLMLPTVIADPNGRPTAGSNAIFRMDELPVVSGWSSLEHLIPHSATDGYGVDSIWARLAHDGGLAVLVVPLALFVVALWCFWLGLRSRPGTAG